MVYDITQQRYIDGNGQPIDPPALSLNGDSESRWFVRDFEGFFQSSESQAGPWRFYLAGFAGDSARAMRYDRSYQSVPIDSRDRVLIAARKLLAAGTAPREVAASLGVSVPTLYRWVPGGIGSTGGVT